MPTLSFEPGPPVIARGQYPSLASKSTVDLYADIPLPGVVIFVHGVNSTGEWFDAAERGLCAGLNERTLRRPEDLRCPVEKTELIPCSYTPELTPNGFRSKDLSGSTFLPTTGHYSPVIRFRWGFRASQKELAAFGGNVFLDEYQSWGGGPFANGCTALPDLWDAGLNDRVFLWYQANALNPTDRPVYACPHRGYFAHAAWRLAALIDHLRQRNEARGHGPDVPVTIVCHSQGNMLSIASAFIGQERFGGKGVADTYVLCNPPYSLKPSNFMENLTQSDQGGRVTGEARREAFRAFLSIVEARGARCQADAAVNKRTANSKPTDESPIGFCRASERANDRINQGRVFLYCNPHDQVISASTVQGIGWRGLDQREIDGLGGPSNFHQRVWADGLAVGQRGLTSYPMWPAGGCKTFWSPPSPQARYSIERDLDDPRASVWGKLGSLLLAPLLIPATTLARMVGLSAINAEPERNRRLPITAPPISDEGVLPKALRMHAGQVLAGPFDEGSESAEDNLATHSAIDDPDDVYNRARGTLGLKAQGDADSEAQLRYEHHARVRMDARASREDTLRDEAEEVRADGHLSERFRQWSDARRAEYLVSGRNQNATDHSTILTNPMHAQAVLAYDIALGYARFTESDWMEFRQMADWRWVGAAETWEPAKEYAAYFKKGQFYKQPLYEHPDYQPNVPATLGIDSRRESAMRPPRPTQPYDSYP
ncbi:T6SS effector phospholipase Tle3 domain-containing protein [Derxia gummosa]|uniref:T6SS effector phospholipase Tle3 domain-containing protein n=1 Tax=Derxia gummosa DSM 723 TaxID=1121388 RepID=A0A8B6X9Q2_9BURK|nr:DUF3274 domain-containing protein [Derxia gummosa]